MSKKSLVASSASLALASLVGAAALPAVAGDQFLSADGFYGDVRIRHEDVEQNNAKLDADATTIRTKLGFKTGVAHGIQALVEIEDVSRMGGNDYDSTINGKDTYSTIPDPVGTEVNQLWVSYAGIQDTLIRVGRQGINLDNQRFVGTVGWRQNDQTFDSVLITNSSIENLSLAFAEVKQVNRIFGDSHPTKGELDTTTRVAHATYKVSDSLTVAGYGLWIDLDDAAAFSSETYGIRVTGSTPLNDEWKLAYEAEFAEQSDYENNPASYDVSYFHVAPALKWKTLTLQVGFESLEGNGSQAFETPLATGHKFNGWADSFLDTPDDGLEDTYVKAAYVIKGQGNLLDNTKLVAVYHQFDADNLGYNYGDELDLLIAHPISTANLPGIKGASIALKYADYNKGDDHANNTTVDTKKWWLTTQFKF